MIFIIISCTDKVNYEKPQDLIGKEEMIDLLYDMHIAVGTSNVKNVHLERNRNYMSLVFDKYGVDSTRFATSNIYYTSNINEYEEIYEEVQRRLDTIKNFYQDRMDSLASEQTTKRNRAIQKSKDSLAKYQKRRN
jgi:hypothetical protein